MPILTDDAAPLGFIDIDKPPVTEGEETWMSVYALSVREMKELEFAKLYVEKFDHGTDGHGRLHLIEHMNSILESLFETNTQLLAENEGFRDILASEGYNVPAVEETMQAEIDVLQKQIDSQTTTLETLQATMPQDDLQLAARIITNRKNEQDALDRQREDHERFMREHPEKFE